MPQVRVRTPVYPSEDVAKVRKAILHLFPGAELRGGTEVVEGTTDSLAGLRKLIRQQKILDAARKVFLRSLDATGTRAVFALGKQAAFEGRVSFSIEGSPLGDIIVHAEDDDLEAILKEMAPMTLRGIPLTEEQAEREVERRRARRSTKPVREPVELISEEEWESLDEDAKEAEGEA